MILKYFLENYFFIILILVYVSDDFNAWFCPSQWCRSVHWALLEINKIKKIEKIIDFKLFKSLYI